MLIYMNLSIITSHIIEIRTKEDISGIPFFIVVEKFSWTNLCTEDKILYFVGKSLVSPLYMLFLCAIFVM